MDAGTSIEATFCFVDTAGYTALTETHGEHSAQNFQGRSITTSDGLAVVARPGFDDAAASIVVADGIWEACNDVSFNGHCIMLRPGNCPRVDIDLAGRIASLHQVGHVASGAPVVVEAQPVVVNPAPMVVTQPQVVVTP